MSRINDPITPDSRKIVFDLPDGSKVTYYQGGPQPSDHWAVSILPHVELVPGVLAEFTIDHSEKVVNIDGRLIHRRLAIVAFKAGYMAGMEDERKRNKGENQ